MSAPAGGEIGILVDQIMAAETALAAARAEAESAGRRARLGEALLAAALLPLARAAIAAASLDPDAPTDAPAVSIVMPVRDRADTIGEAIRSVMAQS